MLKTISAENKNKILINGAPYVDFDFDKVKTSDEFFAIVETFWKQLEALYKKKELDNIPDLFKFLEIEEKWNSTLDRISAEEELKTPISVDGVEYKKIRKFSLLYSGWECDSVGWLIDDNGETKLVLTNHGQEYFAKISELEGFLKSYQKAIDETKEIIAALKKRKKSSRR